MIDRFGHIWRALAVAMALVAIAGAAAAEPQFKRALIFLERNVTDDDIEVRFVATSDEDWLRRAARDRPGRAHGDRFQVARLQARHPPPRS